MYLSKNNIALPIAIHIDIMSKILHIFFGENIWSHCILSIAQKWISILPKSNFAYQYKDVKTWFDNVKSYFALLPAAK